jgi:nicotinamidase-related amidase
VSKKEKIIKMEQNTVLLVMDMQAIIVGRLPDAATVVGNIAGSIAAARERNIPVVYVVVGFRPGMPEISANNKDFAGARARSGGVNVEESMRIEPAVAPLAGEIVVVKRRVSSFTGSDLEVILRAFGARHLVLSGIATSGVVLSTLREAADKDYRITVLADGCADGDEEVHRVLTTKVFPRQADVVGVKEWTASL